MPVVLFLVTHHYNYYIFFSCSLKICVVFNVGLCPPGNGDSSQNIYKLDMQIKIILKTNIPKKKHTK